MCVNTIRVAITGGIPGEAPFLIQRLKTGQPLPKDTMEAMLVLTGEIADSDVSFDDDTTEGWQGRYRTVIAHQAKRAARFCALASGFTWTALRRIRGALLRSRR